MYPIRSKLKCKSNTKTLRLMHVQTLAILGLTAMPRMSGGIGPAAGTDGRAKMPE
jgi:hypothetical protein